MPCSRPLCAGGVCWCPDPPPNTHIQRYALNMPGATASSACTGQLGNNVPCPTPCDCKPCDGGCAPATATGNAYNPTRNDFNGPGIFCLAGPQS